MNLSSVDFVMFNNNLERIANSLEKLIALVEKDMYDSFNEEKTEAQLIKTQSAKFGGSNSGN